ncbi:copper chaperone PCu(A)C [Hyphococcus lacteus]|uniref:Copper chaperone PCu(A)C n=1 Tax=Hyphococcus lacteus TaxID=3143536 RepID=A0ABV3Z589_9PROT
MRLRFFDPRFIATILLTLSSATALAHEFTQGGILVEHPWARPTHAKTVPAAVYFNVVNKGEGPDRLLSVTTTRAKNVEVHKTMIDDKNIARMRPVVDGLTIPAGATVSMETGSYHVMLIGLDAPLKAEERFPVTLTFEKAGEIDVEIVVEDREAAKVDHSNH